MHRASHNKQQSLTLRRAPASHRCCNEQRQVGAGAVAIHSAVCGSAFILSFAIPNIGGHLFKKCFLERSQTFPRKFCWQVPPWNGCIQYRPYAVFLTTYLSSRLWGCEWDRAYALCDVVTSNINFEIFLNIFILAPIIVDSLCYWHQLIVSADRSCLFKL